jgi:hypothetical protein
MRGHVRERGKGNWYAVLDVPDPATGKRRRKWHSLEAKGKREAQIECANLISAIQRGTYVEANKITVQEFMGRWLAHIRPQVPPRTFERYEEIATKNITPMLGPTILGCRFRKPMPRPSSPAAGTGRAAFRPGVSGTSIEF